MPTDVHIMLSVSAVDEVSYRVSHSIDRLEQPTPILERVTRSSVRDYADWMLKKYGRIDQLSGLADELLQ